MPGSSLKLSAFHLSHQLLCHSLVLLHCSLCGLNTTASTFCCASSLGDQIYRRRYVCVDLHDNGVHSTSQRYTFALVSTAPGWSDPVCCEFWHGNLLEGNYLLLNTPTFTSLQELMVFTGWGCVWVKCALFHKRAKPTFRKWWNHFFPCLQVKYTGYWFDTSGIASISI